MLQQILGFLVGIVLLALAIVYASILFALAAAFAIVIGGWIWWKTRDLRRKVREGGGPGGSGPVVIEGEFRVERGVRPQGGRRPERDVTPEAKRLEDDPR